MGVIKRYGALQNDVIKGRALQNQGIIVINQGRARKRYSDKIPGQPKKVMSSGVPGGMGQNNLTVALFRI